MVVCYTLTADSTLIVGEAISIMNDTVSFHKSELIFTLSTVDALIGQAVGIDFDAETLIGDGVALLTF